jgi:putative ABC transport system permease protein
VTLIGLAARNLTRNKVRTVLTVLGVAVAVLTFVFLRTIVSAWTVAADFAAKDRIVTRHKITFIMTLPKRYVDDVRGAAGVKNATFLSWFGGRDPAHETEFFGTFAVDTDTYFGVYDEMVVPAAQLDAWKNDRAGAIVGDVLAQKLGWKVGDRVTLESGIFPAPSGQTWTFTIDGIYTATAKSVDRSTFHFHWAYLNDALPERARDQVGWIVSRIADPSRSADATRALDDLFDARDVQTLSQDERAFNASFLAGISAVLRAIDVVSLAILAVMGLVLGNTIAMGVRERTSEHGVLRAIGFLPRSIAGFVLAEGVLLGLTGGLFGLAIAYPFVERGVGRWLEENMGAMFPYFRVMPSDALATLGAVVTLAALASVVPALGAARLRVTEALRRVA